MASTKPLALLAVALLGNHNSTTEYLKRGLAPSFFCCLEYLKGAEVKVVTRGEGVVDSVVLTEHW